MARDSAPGMLEFFAGGGFARLGLAGAFDCLFANDLDPAKARAYRAAFGSDHLLEQDIWRVGADQAPGGAALAWASSPCQDLSLAGARRGLSAQRSGAFWGFWRLIEALDGERRGPPVIVIENVVGLLTSNGGEDFNALCAALAGSGRAVGAVEIDAARFVPQSRPRVFVIAARDPASLAGPGPVAPFHSKAVIAAHDRLPPDTQRAWVWWRLPPPPLRNASLAEMLLPDGAVPWRSPEQTEALIAQMSAPQRAQLHALQRDGARCVGAVYRRVREEEGQRVQRAEARFDGVAGCLRTPGGGSSRQLLLFVEGERVRSRWLAPREAARLMGVPDNYPLPSGATEALRLLGDAVAPPVVAWLGETLLTPLVSAGKEKAPARARRGEG